MATTVTTEYSPLQNPPHDFSRRQVLFLDGLRYSVEMAQIAYKRLNVSLQSVSRISDKNQLISSAEAMLYAWAIVDSAHRYRDLLLAFPGLKKGIWVKLTEKRIQDVADLRNCVQHQIGEIPNIIERREQFWGYLSWAEIREGRYTGKWLMLTGGSHYVEDSWMFAGPVSLPFQVPPGRIRLNAFGRKVYLGRTVEALRYATSCLATELTSGKVKAEGAPERERKGTDMLVEAFIQVEVSVSQQEEKSDDFCLSNDFESKDKG